MSFAVLPASAEQTAFRDELVEHGILLESGVPGLFGRGAVFEDISARFDALVAAAAAEDRPETLRFPPLLPRCQLEASGYLRSFPHLAGTVFAFAGDEAAARELDERACRHEDWSEFQQMSDVALVPAACYPVYPAIAKRGGLPAGGIVVDTGAAWVFRHEPADDPARMQMFHMRELVRIGTPSEVLAWRDRWRERGLELLRSVGLAAEVDRASDPFFGRGGRMLAANQRKLDLKYELLVPIAGPQPTAVASFNYHQEHFAQIYGLALADGAIAHTACLGFGQERIVLALLHAHGLEPASWPAKVRKVLWGS
jgi:seryl-tRNA synthetase